MSDALRSKQIYKITYPNGKIYVGSDLRGDEHYCGSPSAVRQIADDIGIDHAEFPRYPLTHQRCITRDGSSIKIEILHLSLVLHKEILWESATATDRDVRKSEMDFIRQTSANDPKVGYNKLPKHGATRCRQCTHKSDKHTARGGCMHYPDVCGCTWNGRA